MKRVATALVLVPLVVGLVFFAAPVFTWLALAGVALLAFSEFLSLAGAMGAKPLRIAGYGAGAVIVLAPEAPQLGFLTAAAALFLIASMESGKSLSDAFASVSSTVFGLIYTCAPFALARDLHAMSPHWFFVVLLVNWVGDSAAYFIGRAIGRRKLAPRISPAKTWEGSIASAVLGSAAGLGYLLWALPEAIDPIRAALLVMLINVSGQLGDLSESALKRGAGVKDSGALLPGHGGVLDRVDSLLFSLPAAYLFVVWTGG